MALTLTLAWAALLLVVAIIAGVVIGWRSSGAAPLPRGLLMLLPLAGAAMLWAMWLNIADTPFDEWNGARVAPVMAWWMGLPLYYPPGEGPGTAFIYPPVSAILRLPLAWMSSPTAAVLASAVLNSLFYHVPIAIFIWTIRGPRLMRWIGLLTVWGFSLTLGSLSYSAYFVHADAPALGFGLLACTLLTHGWQRMRDTRRMVLAAGFLALSIGSKQTQVPLLAILPLYALLRYGWRPAFLLAGTCAALLAIMTGICIGVWGWEAIEFNWFGIAAGQPWQFETHGRLASFMIWSGTLVAEATGPALAMGVLYLFMRPTGSRRIGLRRFLLRPWFLPFVIAVVMVPLAIMSLAKRGGWGNSLSITSYHLSVALGGLIAGYRWLRVARQNPLYARAVVSTAALLAIALAAWCATPFTTTRKTLMEIADLGHNPEQTAFAFAQKYPGQAYFPRNPLATLMAEGRYYMFEFGMLDEMQVDKKMGRNSFTAQRIGRYLPPQMKIIAIPPERTAGIARMELPGFTRRVNIDELPNWIVFSRPESP